MQTRTIGSLEVSLVGLGCNNFGGRLDEAGTRAVIDAALDAGVNFFDTADIYGKTQSESFIGRALGPRRHDVILATKFGHPANEPPGSARPEYIRVAVEDSLRRLQTDVIDLYQLHRPDPDTPIADTLGALDDLVRAGKVREIGCSNFTVEQLREAEAARSPGAARFVSVQNEYSLLARESQGELLAECREHGVAYLPYFPLASGLLTGKYRRGQALPEGTRIQAGNARLSEANLDRVEALAAFAEARGHSLLELAFGWLTSQPEVASVIAGAMRPDQVQANVAAVGWILSPQDFAELDQILA